MPTPVDGQREASDGKNATLIFLPVLMYGMEKSTAFCLLDVMERSITAKSAFYIGKETTRVTN